MLLMAALLLPLAANAQCNITLPWTEDFDSYTGTDGMSFPDCWTRVSAFQVSASAQRPNLFGVTYQNHGKVLNFMGQAGSSQGSGIMKAATPYIPAPLNQLELSFEVANTPLSLYAATDMEDESTYVLIGTYGTNSSYTWLTFEVRTDTVAGIPSENGYLVFTAPWGNTGYSQARLDNLTVEALITCQRPASITVESVSPTTASLSWATVEGAQNYAVSYNTVNSIEGAEVVETPYNNVVLGNLEPDTRYYLFVQTICGDGTVSNPRTDSLMTEKRCYPLANLQQVSEGYDAASFAWELDPRGYDATLVLVTLVDDSDPEAEPETHESDAPTYHFFMDLDPSHHYTAYFYTVCGEDTAEVAQAPVVFKPCGVSELAAQGGDYANYPVTTSYKYGISQMVYPATVLYDMDTIRGIALHRKLNETPQDAVTRKLSIWVSDTEVEGLSAYTPVTNMSQVVDNVNFLLPEQEWDTIPFTTNYVHDGSSPLVVTIVDNTGSYNVSGSKPKWMWHESEWNMYYGENDNNNGSYDATSNYSLSHAQRLPDIQFIGDCQRDYTCLTPVAGIGEVDSVRAEVIWVENGGSEWVVEYRQAGATAWITAGTFDSSPFILENLQSSTNYEVRMGTVCGDEIRYGEVLSFTTACAIVHIPFHFSQSDMAVARVNGFSPCWNFTQYFFRGSLTLSSRSAIYNAGNGELAVLPPVAEHLSGARLRTWAGCSSPEQFRVGITSREDAADVEWIDTVQLVGENPNTTTEEYIVYLDRYTGTGNRIVLNPIVSNDYSYVYFFDFHIEPIEGCRPVANLRIDSTDATTMSVSWTPVGPATRWQVEIDATHNGIAEDEPHFTFTDLEPYTDYTVTVKSLCDDDEESLPTSDVFRTGCVEESCLFTVNGHASSGNGWKGGYLDITAGDVSVGEVKMLRGSNVSKTFTVCADMELTFSWLSGNADNECSFSIVNAYGQTVYSTPSAEGLGYAFFVKDSICFAEAQPVEPIDPIDPIDPNSVTRVDAYATVTLAPNPASQSLTVGGIEGRVMVTIADISGREVFRRDNVEGSLSVDVAAFARGTYFVRIVGTKGSAVRKLRVR